MVERGVQMIALLPTILKSPSRLNCEKGTVESLFSPLVYSNPQWSRHEAAPPLRRVRVGFPNKIAPALASGSIRAPLMNGRVSNRNANHRASDAVPSHGQPIRPSSATVTL